MEFQCVIFWVLILFSEFTTGNASHNVCAHEGEPSQIKWPLPSNSASGDFAPTWYRKSESNGLVKLDLETTGRIISKEFSLQFWPAQLSDIGTYLYILRNNISSPELSLHVHRRSKDCYSSDCIFSNNGMISKSFTMQCETTQNKWSDYIIGAPAWYKGCNFLKTEETFHFDELQKYDSGNYTCEVTLTHAGKNFSIRRTTYLILEDPPEITKPRIMGEDITPNVEVEMGKELRLNCTAFVGYLNNSKDLMLYWFKKENSNDETETFIEPCNDTNKKEMQCEDKLTKVVDGKNYITKQLQFQNVQEEDLKYTYICKMSSTVQNDNRTYMLKKKEKTPHIPKHVFAAGMTTAVIFSAIAIIMVVLCLIFRVDLVLLYRDLMGRDETLADGKEFDAYVSYLNECMLASEDEREFVLQILPNILENHYGYKLCIFERDVTPGGAIVDDIHSFIEKSRRLIIILTRNYMSDKAMYEIESGLHIALVEKKIQVILIEFKPLRDFKFIPESLSLLKSNRIVKWKAKKSVSLNSRFWKNIRYLMPAKPDKSRVNMLSNPLFWVQKCIYR
ncbi:interleukin-18 receptor 1 [Microcaecilia unicolor]|uniref:Interleukin-18 receptor 1 n=1 Tax=Microcaecilia unicolor TaxID=1415580 RepID=A0A6P7Y2T0_9AMPH|nr:interleukin-18 receptor 1 [Microcaecilia unicolor]XP_030057306.1 interleukin-18 receptor 1 [Microcaecilia unicolor]XP_030057307.1 interleukin-18 receptor 1 [Microcaecilia unicolor]XP_030057308.1 interleukin-18 receptor 1 [Microcaecilia unicolor]